MPELKFLVIHASKIYKKIKTNNYTVNINLQNKSNIYGSIRCFFEFNGNVYFILRQFLIKHVNIIYHRVTMMKVKHILSVIYTKYIQNVIYTKYIHTFSFFCKIIV